MLENLSKDHTKDIIIACQETWKYAIPASFQKEFEEKYFFIHESAMDPTSPRKRGRPYGGVCLIISRNIAYKILYKNCRCISILLTNFNILLSNVFLSFF